jgi:hypothetical protein
MASENVFNPIKFCACSAHILNCNVEERIKLEFWYEDSAQIRIVFDKPVWIYLDLRRMK